MLILGQNKDMIVNLDQIHSITVYKHKESKKGEGVNEKKFRILAWYGDEEYDYWELGDFTTEDRAKCIVSEIFSKYGEYIHRPYSPAIFRGTSDVEEALFVLPKIYEIPEQ